jgi:hypothetical protein
MDSNAQQPPNGKLSIRLSLEPESNVNDESDEQREKHSLQRTSTDDGIQMDFSARHLENAPSLI